MKQKEMIEQAIAMIERGDSMRKTARHFDLSPSTLSHWLKKVKDHDGDIEAAFEEKAAKGGRPKAADQFSEYEKALAKWYRLSKESVDVAAHFFARDHRVSTEASEVIRGYEDRALEEGKRIAWPKSILRIFYVTENEKAAFRGKKASQQVEMVTRRGMFEILADGTVVDILPGNTWELDDYSTNQPYIYHHPETGEKMLGRQVLAARDLSAAFWLGFDHIGRERDAYRSEDVLRFIERLIRAHGMPKRLRLERGIWESSGVHGIPLDGSKEKHYDGVRWGDLRDLMEIEHVFKSKSKSIIEGGFNVLQRWLGHTGTDIGRRRGEFEEATKRFLTAKRKNVDPATLGFLTQDKSSTLHAEAAVMINSRPMMRSHLNERVSPDDLVARQGWHTHMFNEADAWYFLPCKKSVIVRGGHVEVNPGGGWPTLTFTVNGVVEDVYLENGHRVLVACDPARPDLGAYLCNGDHSVKNREGYHMGEFLMQAPHLGLSPQFNATQQLSPHLVSRRKASSAAATTFRSIKSAAMSGKSVVEKRVTTGKGATIEVGTIQRKEHTAISEPEVSTPRKPEEVETSARMSRFSSTRRTPAEEIAKLTKSLTD